MQQAIGCLLMLGQLPWTRLHGGKDGQGAAAVGKAVHIYTCGCGCGCHDVRSGSFFVMPPFTRALYGAVNSFGVKAVYIRPFRKPIGLAEQRTSRAPSG